MALGQASKAPLRAASAIAYDAAGNLYIADANAHQVYEATLAGALVLIAGNGTQGSAGDGGQAVEAQLNQPQGLAVGSDGTLYIADTGNHRVRAVGASGVVTTVAGTGVAGFAGDGGSAISASLRGPTALAVNTAGELLICDTGNQRIRRVSAGVITTVAGSGVQGFSGDGGAAVAAQLDTPEGVVSAPDGRIFVADSHNHRIRVISGSGTIVTFAGRGIRGFGGDGGPAVDADLSSPRGLALDTAGNLLVADANNQRFRSITAGGIISTVAGSGVEGTSPDGTAVLAAALRTPRAVGLSSFGLPALADTANGTVRIVANAASLYQPAALTDEARSSTLPAAATLVETYGGGVAQVPVSGSVDPLNGSVQAREGISTVSTGLVQEHVASLDLSALPAGTHPLTLTYLGDGLNPASTSEGALTVQVQPAPVIATANSVTVPYGSALPTFSGTMSGVLPQDTAQVNAVFAVNADSLPPVGSYLISGSLTGSRAGNYSLAMASSSGKLTVTKAASTAALGAVAQAYPGVSLTLSARVAPATGGQPTGSVQFLEGSTVLGTAALNSGTAAFAYTPASAGVRQLAVQYLGDGNFLPSTSAATGVGVVPLPDFSVASGGPATASVAAGSTATYSLSVTAQPGPFTGAISLSATGLPAGATATFSPPQVIPGSGVAMVTMNVQVPSSTATASRRGEGFGSNAALASCLLGSAAFLASRRRRRLSLLLTASVLLMAGCGARTVGGGVAGLVSQSYTLQITGTGTNLAGLVVTHSTSLTLTVQQ